MRTAFLAIAVLGAVIGAAGTVAADDVIYKEGGLTKVKPYPVDAKFRNAPWPADLEKGFWERANHAIAAYKGQGGGATTGEHEKWGYPKSMFDILAGDREKSIGYLESPDGEQSHTFGVDYYWGFTLKNQPRKYFWFGKHAGLISKGHLEKMRRAAEVWLKDDPRPTMELVLALESNDPQVRTYALELLRKMRGVDLDEVAKKATNDELKAAIAEFRKTPLAKGDYGDDLAKWRAWWKFFADHDWKVFEEYERVINPNPHPQHGVGTGPVGTSWDAKVRGGWADARNTDNLRSMRETCAYLMAEETGNEKLRRLYKEKLKRFVVGLYHVGMGEWDSENYHAHSIAPWLGLYDFAEDPEVKLMGKAACDWLCAAAALKYYRGGYGGPTKRDYGGGNRVFGAGVTHMMYLYFGDCPIEDPEPHYDDVHAVTSTYRPPMAVVGLARKQFDRPVEMWDTKPTYSHWLPGRSDAPEFRETLFFGDTFYLGTCVAKGGSGDVGPFKLLAFNSKRGVDFVVAYSGKRWNTMRGGDQIAQYRNLVVHLRPQPDAFNFLIAKTAKTENDGGIWFIQMEKTWVAVRPINLGAFAVAGIKGKEGGQYKGEQILSADAKGNSMVGYAMEVGEGMSYTAFKQAVRSKGKLDLSAIAQGTVTLAGSDGHVLKMTYNRENDLPHLVRDGKPREWMKEFDLYKPVGADGPMSLGWKEGALTINAGGHEFSQTVTSDGKVTFADK